MKIKLQLSIDAVLAAMRARGHELAVALEPRRAAPVRIADSKVLSAEANR